MAYIYEIWIAHPPSANTPIIYVYLFVYNWSTVLVTHVKSQQTFCLPLQSILIYYYYFMNIGSILLSIYLKKRVNSLIKGYFKYYSPMPQARLVAPRRVISV